LLQLFSLKQGSVPLAFLQRTGFITTIPSHADSFPAEHQQVFSARCVCRNKQLIAEEGELLMKVKVPDYDF
jgi:hypothetical protein